MSSNFMASELLSLTLGGDNLSLKFKDQTDEADIKTIFRALIHLRLEEMYRFGLQVNRLGATINDCDTWKLVHTFHELTQLRDLYASTVNPSDKKEKVVNLTLSSTKTKSRRVKAK